MHRVVRALWRDAGYRTVNVADIACNRVYGGTWVRKSPDPAFGVPVSAVMTTKYVRPATKRSRASVTSRVVVMATNRHGVPATASRTGVRKSSTRPGAASRVGAALLTNSPLPRSALLLLVAAFAGREPVLAAYREALALGYRFYSYGDAMWIAHEPK